MSVSTWDGVSHATSAGTRQRQRRQTAQHAATENIGAPRAAVVPAAVKSPALADDRSKGRQLGGLSLAVLAVLGLHVGAIGLWQSAPPAAPQVVKKQVTVELVKPTEPEKIEPPKPLPQKLTPPPKLAPIPKAAPRPVARPTPAPVATPQKIEPVVTNAPVPAVTIPAPPPPTPVQAAEPVAEPVTQAIGYAGYLHNPPPVYPANAQRMGLEGKVILKVRVLASGKPSSVDVQTSSGRKTLDDAAIAAVSGWLFSPSRRGQTPVDGWATVPIEFKLERS